MQDDELLRYSRHILLDDIGIEGQERWRSARVLIVGAGGLGSPAVLYLAAAGVGHITLVDPDNVDLTNLQRQIAHTTSRIGQPKVLSAAAAAEALNPLVTVDAIAQRADVMLLDSLIPAHDVVLDCTDNFQTRHTINAACVRLRKPLVAGAAIQFDGQITVFDPRDTTCPCYACLFPQDADSPDVQCATMGVFAPLVGIIGCMQAAEALKLLACIGTPLSGRMLMLDGRRMEWTELKLTRSYNCKVCA